MPAPATLPALAMLFYHTHKGSKRWLNLQNTQYDLIAGTAAHPKYLKVPIYLAKGDALTCEIANAYQVNNIGNYGNTGYNYVGVDFYVALDGIAIEDGQKKPSPQLLSVPQFGIHSRSLLPFPWHLPPGDARSLGFNFPGTPALGSASLDLGIKEDLMIYAIHAKINNPPQPAPG